MTVHLCIPHAPVPLPDGRTAARTGHTTVKLRWTTHHPLSSRGLGVLLDVKGQAMDGHQYRHLRSTVGAWITSDDDAAVRGALGLPPGESLGPPADALPSELSVGQAAAILGVNDSRVRQRLIAGDFPAARKAGRDWVVPRRDVEAAKARRAGVEP